MSGPAAGLTKRFCYPGFTERTGGLILESDFAARRAAFDRDAWRASMGLPVTGERLASLFCYEPAGLASLITRWQAGPQRTRLLVTPGRARAALQAVLPQGAGGGALAITHLPHLTQTDYDHLLWACDLNFVRGEDSMVRALWSGRPFVWQIYPQDDQAHHAKLEALLAWQQAPAAWRAFHRAWNGIDPAEANLDPFTNAHVPVDALARLQTRPDLVTHLREMAAATIAS